MLAKRARTALAVVGALAAALILTFVLSLFAGPYLVSELGIQPRRLDGLDGILFAPLLHANLSHLLGNLLPLLVFSFLTLLEGVRRFVTALASSWLASGIGVWLFGGGLTVGISGVVFGLFAYLIVRGFYNRSVPQVLLAVVLFLIYGSLLWGLLPTALGVSWQAHLFGAVGGVLAAVLMRTRGPGARMQKRVPR